MYTEQDRIQIRQRIQKYSCITAVFTLAVIALYVVCLKQRWEIMTMVTGAVLFAVIAFGWLMFIWPCVRYSMFLKDMKEGLGREVKGSIVEVSAQEDYQDGVRVLPVRIFLEEEQDERIVYLNATKAEGFPKAGAKVTLNCFGRHIKGFTLEN